MCMLLLVSFVGCGSKTSDTTTEVLRDSSIESSVSNEDKEILTDNTSIEELKQDALEENKEEAEIEEPKEGIIGAITKETTMVKTPAEPATVDCVKSILASMGISDFEIYDISAVDENGAAVQPEGKVSVSLTIPENLKGYTPETEEISVLYFDPERLIFTECATSVKGDYVYFETTHFSHYVLVLRARIQRPEGYNGEVISYLSMTSKGTYASHSYIIYVTKEGVFEGDSFKTLNSYVTWNIDGKELPIDLDNGDFIYNGALTPPFLTMYKLFGYQFYATKEQAEAADTVRGGAQDWDGVIVTANDYEFVANMHNTLKDITYKLGYDLNWLAPVD